MVKEKKIITGTAMLSTQFLLLPDGLVLPSSCGSVSGCLQSLPDPGDT